MRRRIATFTLTLLIVNSLSALAADKNTPADPVAPIAAAITRVAENAEPATNVWRAAPPPRRPALLPVLYGTYATLQALDAASTKKALAASAYEANPVLKSGSMGAMLAVKAAGGAATIYFAERAWKKNRVGAIVLMAALNGATAAIAVHNMQNARR